MSLLPPFDKCYQAALDKDARFDGWIYGGVTSTGIYCRPSCPARTPKAANMRFFPTAAAAQAAGFRACKRCRPDATPGSPEWDLRADVASRAMRLIADGVVDREGVPGLAARLGYSERHVHRQLNAVVGAGPLAIARAARAQNARILLETTTLPVADVAFAAGFASVRQFNETMRAVFAEAPRDLRRKARPQGEPSRNGVALRLPLRPPFDFAAIQRFLAARAVEGVEFADADSYARSMRLANGGGVMTVRAGAGHVCAHFVLDDLRDLGSAVERARRLLDLDADPTACDAALSADRRLAAPVARRAGLRVPGAVSGEELAIRAVLGQQISVAGAARAAAKLAAAYGDPLRSPQGEVALLFPSAGAIAGLAADDLPMPRARGRALIGLCAALASGDLVVESGADRAELRAALIALPGIGPWTADYIAMRALRDPDAFLPGDLGVRRGLEALGADGSPAAAEAAAERWRPYRAYALQHLWAIAGDAAADAGKRKAGRR